MAAQPGDSYFTTHVLTAPPHKLHLMLLEGALRQGRRAEALLEQGCHVPAGDALIRGQEIMSELIGSLRPDVAPELARRVASVYLFIQRSFVQAQLQRDIVLIRGALKVLEEECETWRQLCLRVDGATAAPNRPGTAPPRPIMLDLPNAESEVGVSFEA